MVAIERGHLSMIRYLLERGMSTTGSIVRVALEARSIPVLEILREIGWDVNIKLTKMGGNGIDVGCFLLSSLQFSSLPSFLPLQLLTIQPR